MIDSNPTKLNITYESGKDRTKRQQTSKQRWEILTVYRTSSHKDDNSFICCTRCNTHKHTPGCSLFYIYSLYIINIIMSIFPPNLTLKQKLSALFFTISNKHNWLWFISCFPHGEQNILNWKNYYFRVYQNHTHTSILPVTHDSIIFLPQQGSTSLGLGWRLI